MLVKIENLTCTQEQRKEIHPCGCWFLHLCGAVQKRELLLFVVAVTAHKDFFSITSGGNFIFGDAVGNYILVYWKLQQLSWFQKKTSNIVAMRVARNVCQSCYKIIAYLFRKAIHGFRKLFNSKCIHEFHTFVVSYSVSLFFVYTNHGDVILRNKAWYDIRLSNVSLRSFVDAVGTVFNSGAWTVIPQGNAFREGLRNHDVGRPLRMRLRIV